MALKKKKEEETEIFEIKDLEKENKVRLEELRKKLKENGRGCRR